VTRYGKASGWQRSCAAFACVPIVALLLLAPPPATAAISLGPTIDLPSQAVDFGGATVAVLADGSFAIAGYRYDLGFPQYQVQFFSAGGDLLPPVLLEAPVGYTEPPGFAGVGSLGSSYFVVWQPYRLSHANGAAVADRHAFAQLYSKKGTPLGSPFPWPSSAVPDFAEFYRFGSAPRWRFLPITYDLLTNDVVDGPIYRVSLRVAEPSKVLQAPPIQVGPPVVSNVEDAAINGTGRFVVASDQCASYPPPAGPCIHGIQIFHDGMRPLTPFLTAGIAQNGTLSAAINAQGQVFLTFIDSAGRLLARLYDEKGSPASDEIRADTTQEPFEVYVGEMKGLDDGSFVLGWFVFRVLANGAHGEELVLRRFDPHARTFEEPVVIDPPSNHPRSAVLKLNGDGRGVVVWQNEDAAGFPADAHLRLIRVTP
jgi:hypothetical protein